jgi:S-DNA-T family DNA segregation ATPase FtsK/SpoIIIE
MSTHPPFPTPDPDHNHPGDVVPFRPRAPHPDPADQIGPRDADGRPVDAVPGLVNDAVSPGTEIEPAPEVVDAELMPDPDDTDRADQTEEAIHRTAQVAVRQAADIVRWGTGHPHTKAAGRALVRHGHRVWQGHVSWARRGIDAATHAHLREQVRSARATGETVALAEWHDRLQHARQARRDAVRALPATVWAASKVVAVMLLGLAMVLLVAGIAFQVTGIFGGWWGWWDLIATLAHVTLWLTALGVRIAVIAALPGLLYAAWREGTRRGQTPRWLATAAEVDADITIDETTIAAALAALRIPAVRDYLKSGAPLQYLTPARRDGRGTHAVVRLPGGVTAEKIARRRADLASGLHRRPNEVWPTMGSEAGILDLWIADKGALAEGAGPYPLLEDGVTDVFKGVPFGRSLRGEPLLCPLRGRNTIVGGMPDQGKSSAARVVMVGVALDPTAEMRIWVPDQNFDFEAFAPRCSRYVMGAEDAAIEQICLDLEELVAEIQRRGHKLIEYGEPEVTRELASKNVGMHPIVALLEEAHIAFRHPKFGAQIATAAEEVVRLGRKRFIHLITSTQATTGQSVPQGVTINSANGIAFAVARHQENDALLGQGAYSAGHRATDLIPGTDKGNAVVKGFTADRSVVAQAYFVSVSKQHDQVTPIITRAMAAIAKRGKGVPGAGSPARQRPAARNLLEDLDAVLGSEPMAAARVPALLQREFPEWTAYKSLTGTKLVARLADEYGVKVPSTNNRWLIDPATVREALARLATADLDGQD